MIFNEHSDLKGLHAFLGASKYHWLNYDDAKLISSFRGQYAQVLGTTLHEIAANLIQYNMKLAKNDKKIIRFELEKAGVPSYAYDIDYIFENLANYVNDAIGFRLKPEVTLKYSQVCFGTADAIDYKERDKFLRIHDYKSGTTPASMDQLLIYAGLFYLEYKDRLGLRLDEMDTELRIYQNNDIIYLKPTVEDIAPVVDKIIFKSKLITDFRERGV